MIDTKVVAYCLVYDLLSSEGSSKTKAFVTVKGDVGLIVVTCDLSLKSWSDADGLLNYVGQGRAAPQAIAELVETTKLLRQEAEENGFVSTVVWAVHFPPMFPQIDASLELLLGQDLVAAAGANHIQLILSGHTHSALEYEPMGKNILPKVICCGATTGLSHHEIYSFNIIELSYDEMTATWSTNTTQRKWDREDAEFLTPEPLPTP
jgi:hypothetical protein